MMYWSVVFCYNKVLNDGYLIKKRVLFNSLFWYILIHSYTNLLGLYVNCINAFLMIFHSLLPTSPHWNQASNTWRFGRHRLYPNHSMGACKAQWNVVTIISTQYCKEWVSIWKQYVDDRDSIYFVFKIENMSVYFKQLLLKLWPRMCFQYPWYKNFVRKNGATWRWTYLSCQPVSK